MRIFVQIDPDTSLAATARKLGISPASVTRAVATLEDRVGELLLDRSTRRLALTASGMKHLAVYIDVIQKLDHLEKSPSTSTLSGTLTITAPELFGRIVVAPVLNSFGLQHSDAQLRLLLLNRMVDLVGEGIDLAVRIAEPGERNLKAICLGSVSQVICAAPSYLDKIGEPETPQDLKQFRCIGLNSDGFEEQWRFSHEGKQKSHRVRCSVTTNSAAAAIDIARHGGGITRALSYQVEDLLERQELRELLAAFRPARLPVHLVHRHSVLEHRMLRAVVEHLRANIPPEGFSKDTYPLPVEH